MGALRSYVEHLAVSPRLRGQNMGSKALAAFCQGRRVILEIDPPEDEISVRRQHFDQRLGFVANPYAYIHPSFRRPASTKPMITSTGASSMTRIILVMVAVPAIPSASVGSIALPAPATWATSCSVLPV